MCFLTDKGRIQAKIQKTIISQVVNLDKRYFTVSAVELFCSRSSAFSYEITKLFSTRPTPPLRQLRQTLNIRPRRLNILHLPRIFPLSPQINLPLSTPLLENTL